MREKPVEPKKVEKCGKCGAPLEKALECSGGTLNAKTHLHCPICHRVVDKPGR